ncbi:MAG: DUF2752 domain-containing protein [Wenzhouxiangella sp.]
MKVSLQGPSPFDWELLGLAMAAFLAPILVVWIKILAWPTPNGHSRWLWDFPCPLCGGTRSLELLMSGNWSAALAMNPMVTLLISAFLLWLPYAALVLWRKWPRLRITGWTTSSVRWATAAAMLLVLANWAYVWWMGI